MTNSLLDIISPLSKSRRDALLNAAKRYPCELIEMSRQIKITEMSWVRTYKINNAPRRGNIVYPNAELIENQKAQAENLTYDMWDEFDTDTKTELICKLENMLKLALEEYDYCRQATETPELRGFIVTTGQGLRFPSFENEAARISDHAWQKRDLTGIISIRKKQICADGTVKYVYQANTLRNVNNILDSINKKWPKELRGLRIAGIKLDGAAGWFYHDDIFKLIAKYKEEECLRRLIIPPHGESSAVDAEVILQFWNSYKSKVYQALKGNPDTERITDDLDKMNYPGPEICLKNGTFFWQIKEESSLEQNLGK